MAAYWFVDRIMGKVIDSLFDYLKDHYSSQIGMEKECERLRFNYLRIKSLVSVAENQIQITDPGSPLNQWIWKLRDAVDEADDLIDDFEYMKHKHGEQLETNARSSSNWLSRKFQRVSGVGVGSSRSDPDLERLKEVVRKLDEVSSEVNCSIFLHLINVTEKKEKEQLDELSKARETGSLPAINDFIGRDKDKESIIKWLMKPSNEDVISLLSVEGHGGMGKTTLLQHVYNDGITKEFKLKMWVCVSTNFDVKKVIADMLESLKLERTSLDTIEALQRSLLDVVKSEKFLLVLDDIWLEEQDRDKWEKVFAPLSHGGLGSKILITTRTHDAASMIAKVINKRNESLILKGLEDDKCLELLNTHAFARENPDDHKKLKSIAEELVKKLYGCPLAAKVIGGVLNDNLDERYWTNMSKKVMGHNAISYILNLSYKYLPKELQNCFAFCSIFPQDHIFDKDDLVRMWIAVGFIQPSTNGQTMEDTGKRHFDILVNKSFFDKQVEREYNIRDSEKYKMHDLLHEVAQSVSAQECFRVVGDEDLNLTIPETVRHLSVETKSLEVLKKIGKCKKLQTLRITYDIVNQDFVNVLTEVFKATRSIRLLSICAVSHTMILKTIECLKHLRYLNLYFPTHTLLSRSLSNLYHLQFILLHQGLWVDHPGNFFPSDMNNLSNLRYTSFYSFKFPGIGKLKFLQKLRPFYVENKPGYGIEELKDMNDLHILRIEGLENVRNAKDAGNANLRDKRKLEDLSLQWADIQPHNSDLDEGVLDNLQPHENLKELTMDGYMGVRSAIWMNNANIISNLQNISLSGCLEWKILPPFGQLPFLKVLSLSNMPKAIRFDNKFHGNATSCVFKSLEELYIQKLKALVDWFDARVDSLFPRLTRLLLRKCPNLQELPYLPPMLEALAIEHIGWNTLNCCNISKFIPLKNLNVCHCPKITHIFLVGAIIDRLEARIEDCPNMISFGEHQEVGITENVSFSVERLQLELECIPLKSLSDLHPSLCTLNLVNLKDLDCLPCLSSLSFLRKLYICDVPQLQILPDLPPSLHELHLLTLHNLNFLPSLSSLTELEISHVPQLQELPDLPASLCKLSLQNLNSLPCLSSLSHLSRLTELLICHVPQLKELPDLPPSLHELSLDSLPNLNCCPFSCLLNLSSLTKLRIISVDQLQELSELPRSLRELDLYSLTNLVRLPSNLPSLNSLTTLDIFNVPQLRELTDLPASLCSLLLSYLENLNCLPTNFPSLSSLTDLCIDDVPELLELGDLPPCLRELKLCYLAKLGCQPSFLSSLSSLTKLNILSVPKLRELLDLPPSLFGLDLDDLDSLNCLSFCLPSLSSLTYLKISKVPQLRELPDLPPSLHELDLNDLDSLNCLSSCLPSLSSLKYLMISKVPQLRELPDLPASVCRLSLQELDNLHCLPSFSSLKYLNLMISQVPQLRELPDMPPCFDLQIRGNPELKKRYEDRCIPNIYIRTKDDNNSTDEDYLL